MAQLSNTTDQSGLVQIVEFWTRRPYGSTGNELREIIVSINRAFERIMPLLLSYNDTLRWDDINHTDKPVGTTNLVSSQNDYKITTDDNSLDILNITDVYYLPTATSTTYSPLRRVTMDHPRAQEFVSPVNTTTTGTPSEFLELGNIVYLDIKPSYSATNGLKFFFQRQQAYFTVTGSSGNDTTEPGIPLPFHELLALYASLDWLSVNRTDDVSLLNLLRERIDRREKELRDSVAYRHPSRAVMTPKLDDKGVTGGHFGRNIRFYG